MTFQLKKCIVERLHVLENRFLCYGIVTRKDTKKEKASNVNGTNLLPGGGSCFGGMYGCGADITQKATATSDATAGKFKKFGTIEF